MSENRSAKATARWRQIAETLGREISEDRFADGRLPIEPELADRFAVNRHTIRHAVSMLLARGVVKVTQDRGTFVADHQIDCLL